MGRIGSAVAERLGPWSVRILATDPHVAWERARQVGATLVGLDTLVQEADFISVHVAVTPKTKSLLGEREFRMMKSSAYLINTSRGDVIDEPALVKAMEKGWIAGAALDVFWQEPLPPAHPLRKLNPEKVILTPHKIGHAAEASRANHYLAVESLLKGLKGKVPDYTVNREAIPRWHERIARF